MRKIAFFILHYVSAENQFLYFSFAAGWALKFVSFYFAAILFRKTENGFCIFFGAPAFFSVSYALSVADYNIFFARNNPTFIFNDQ